MIKHQYKNITLDLPKNWVYKKEQGDIEACFDPQSQSTLRIHLMQVKAPEGSSEEKRIKSLTGGLDYTLTKLGYFITNPQIKETVEQNNKLTVFSWRLIQILNSDGANIIILTYTILATQKDSEQEKKMVKELQNSFEEATFT
jgi:hypothetical protein